jgi:phage protein D
VRGQNVLHRLRSKQYTTSWQNLTDSQIVENLATLPDPQTGKRRFPIPIRTNREAKADEQPRPFVAQENQYDLDFLLSLARRNAYVVRVDPKPAGDELYFGPSKDANLRAVEYRLGWGKSLIDFKPTLTTANQIKSVTVNGWNRRTKRAIVGKASFNDCGIRHNPDLKELLMRCDPREEQVVNEPVSTPVEAKKRACAILKDRTRELVKATGTTVGLPNLRSGVMVHIENIGSRFSGRYFVTETTHTIGPSGYTTRFSARREDEGTES